MATRSHVKALLEIGDYLANLGHTIVFATQQNNIYFSKGYNISNIILPGDTTITNEIPDIKDDKEDNIYTNNRLFSKALAFYLPKFYDLTFPSLNQLVMEHKFDLIMCDYIAYSCQDIAKKSHIPLVVGHQAMDYVTATKNSYQTGIGEYGPLTTEGLSFLGRYNYQFLQPLKKMAIFLRIDKSLKEVRAKYQVDKGAFLEDNKYALIIINSFFGFETSVNIPPNYHVLGPLTTLPKDILDDNIGQFLDSRNRVLFVAFGSFAKLKTAMFTTLLQSILQAIEAGVIDGVIWGLGNAIPSNLPDTIIMPNTNKHYDTNKLFNNEYSNVKLLKWAQQYQILNHKNTKLFLTHGGMESISEATLTSTPMLCLPIFGDQPMNAMKIERMGIGSYLNPETLTIDSIINKIYNIILDEDKKVELNLKKYKLITDHPEKRIQYASELVIKHVELSKLCRPKHPFKESDVVPCELEHLIHKATLLNPIVQYNLDIYLINIIFSFIIVYLTYKNIRLVMYYAYNAFVAPKLKVKKI